MINEDKPIGGKELVRSKKACGEQQANRGRRHRCGVGGEGMTVESNELVKGKEPVRGKELIGRKGSIRGKILIGAKELVIHRGQRIKRWQGVHRG